MLLREIIGKKITNIYVDIHTMEGEEYRWLEQAECFIELDHDLIFNIPFSFNDDILIKPLNKNAESLFKDLSNIPVFHINKEKKSISKLNGMYVKKGNNIFSRIKDLLIRNYRLSKAYKPYKLEYQENKLKHLQNRTIVDFLYDKDSSDKGYIELDNGYIITEIVVSPKGTGLAGLNYYEIIGAIEETTGSKLMRISEKK
jgi:hypothetical protein